MQRALSTSVVLLFSCLLAAPSYSRNTDDEMTYWVLLLMPGCLKHVSGFSSRAEQPYEKWRQQHIQEAEKFGDQSSSFSDAAISGNDLDKLRIQCEQLLQHIQDDMLPADARFATPEATWNAFVEALRLGDKPKIAECFSPGGRPKYMSSLQQLTSAQLAEMGNSFTGFQLMKDGSETYQEAAVTRATGMAGIALFVKTKRGWLLSQL